MKLELVVNLTLQATHSLEEREEPHSHRWDIQIGLEGDLDRGRVVSLTEAQEVFNSILRPLQNTFLNKNEYLDASSRDCPTCENLAFYFHTQLEKLLPQLNPKSPPKLAFIQVGIWDEGVQLGFARLSV
ncbi:hypothetical protein EBT16_10130 [bacterium]|nr:hypothetical protein [bacterium]